MQPGEPDDLSNTKILTKYKKNNGVEIRHKFRSRSDDVSTKSPMVDFALRVSASGGPSKVSFRT